MGHIQLLPPEEARKIAAGEVVDRPAALVREFIDNAIDAGPSLIELAIEAGGKKRVEVSDDGSGMERGDLQLACLTHATSKIRALDDLLRAKTLGFRGEALAAAAAVSRLEILTSADGIEGWRLTSLPEGGAARIEAARRVRGTTVRALGLFDTIPARKRFLKRDSSENLLCRQIFTEKALAFPALGFRFLQDSVLKQFLPACSGAAAYKARFAQAVSRDKQEAGFLYEINAVGEGFSVIIVIGGPEIYRDHRREQFIFANGRRINEYGLLQAMEYGVQGAFPNGCHPVGAIFITIDPALADFNVHPAKREAKFADISAIHHAITSSLRMLFHQLLAENVARSGVAGTAVPKPAPELPDAVFGWPGGGAAGWGREAETEARRPESADAAAFGGPDGGAAGWERGAETEAHRVESVDAAFGEQNGGAASWGREAGTEARGPESVGAAFGGQDDGAASSPRAAFRYIGSAFSLFLLVEKDGRLFAVDQHAAHERILYNRLLSRPVVRQELLVPIMFNTEDSAEDAFLEARRETLARLGVTISGGHGAWRIEALPALWRAGDTETVRALLDLRNAGENIAERWAATVACHGALRDGDVLDDEAALSLAAEAFALPVPRCPHGRPIIAEIKKEDLLRAVRRL